MNATKTKANGWARAAGTCAVLALAATAWGCATEVSGAEEEGGEADLEEIGAVGPCERKYADSYRGWPVGPRNQQHPVRASFLDPRTKGYHNGIDISVRDDQPEPGAPPGRTHKVFALEGGEVWQVVNPPSPDREGLVRLGHFGYGHIQPVVKLGQKVVAGQHIGWTTFGEWHLHLSEWCFLNGDKKKRIAVNPLDRRGKIAPYVDTAKPVIHGVGFYRPANPQWRSVSCTFGGQCAVFPESGTTVARQALSGIVDVRAHIEDPGSFRGWLDQRPEQENHHHPSRVHVRLTSKASGQHVIDRDVFYSGITLGAASALLGRTPIPISRHYAPGTRENLRGVAGGKSRLWFRLFAGAAGEYWDTSKVPNGTYVLKVSATDVAGNTGPQAWVEVTIAN